MGNTARDFTVVESSEGDDSRDRLPLGDLLGGRFADVTVDSVETVRRLREDG